MEEDVHWGIAPEIAEEDVEGLDESPAVGVSLGWATFTSVRSSLSKLVKGKRCPTR